MVRKPTTFQGHAWTFTINNYTDKDEDAVKSLADFASYVVCGKETGDQGTPHLQGYVYMLKKASKKAVSRVLQRAALFPSRGTDFDNYGYSAKQDLWYKFGNPPCQGQRSDIDAVDGLTTMRDIVTHSTSYQSLRLAQIKLVTLEPKREWLPTVIWIYGPSGTGKTRSIFDAYGYDAVHKQDQFKWWQGYDGHEYVIIDDFRCDFCKFTDFIKLIDRYPYRVEQKGGERQLRARYMFITSCLSPFEVYLGQTDEKLKQLIRRIKYICLVNDDGIFRFTKNPYHKGIFVF